MFQTKFPRINLPLTYKKLYYKGEPFHYSDLRDLKLQKTDINPVTFYIKIYLSTYSSYREASQQKSFKRNITLLKIIEATLHLI